MSRTSLEPIGSALSIVLIAACMSACGGSASTFGNGSASGSGGGAFGGGGSSGGGAGGSSGGGGSGGSSGGIPGGSGNTSEPVLLYTTTLPGAAIRQMELSDDGSTLVFVSDDDPLGTNPDQFEEIFSLDIASDTLVQITDQDLISFSFDMTADGSQIVFSSNADYTGGNPAFNRNIFLADTDGSAITQVTNVSAAYLPQISADGSLIVFTSDGDLVGANPSLVTQIFLVNANGLNLVQVTVGDLSPDGVRFAPNGSRIAYQSTSNPFGANTDGSLEVFVVNPNGTGHMQLTLADGEPSTSPEFSGDGSLIALTSEGELIAGTGTNGFDDLLYIARADGTGIVQITDDSAGAADVSADGQFVVFTALGNLTGETPGSVRDATVYWARTDGTGLAWLLTDDRLADPGAFDPAQREALFPEISGDGSLIVFQSTLNYTADASGSNEKIYLIER